VTDAPDGVLVQQAAAGSGASFAVLYDRYELSVFNYCLRLLSSPDDAADATQEAFVGVLRRLQTDDRPVLDFASYLFTAARHESYAVMRRRERTRPTDEPPEDPLRIRAVDSDPERAALLQDSQDQVRAANARLAPRYREVLALREVAGLSYGEIAAILGVSANAAAQLLWRARRKLREELRIDALASVTPTSEDCERAQLLIGMREDGEQLEELDADWLDEHLEECGSCRASRSMLLEVGMSYRAWLPVAALAGLRPDVLVHAGEVVGADWSGVAAAGRRAGQAGSKSGTMTAAGGLATIAAVGLALAVLQRDDPREEQVGAEARAPGGEAVSRAPLAQPKRSKRATPPGRRASAARAHDRGDDAPPVPAGAPEPAAGGVGEPLRRGSPPPQDPGRPPPPPPPSAPPGAPVPTPPGPSSPDSPPLASPAPYATPPLGPCTHPGGGLPGCPPGHGGVPPGHGGVPPGLGAPPPGHSR
jgi:RNA polymerase sigma factor (sigma-70 family)